MAQGFEDPGVRWPNVDGAGGLNGRQIVDGAAHPDRA
jgi:hypothetical protein